MNSLREVAMQQARIELLNNKTGDLDWWTTIEYGKVMFDLNIWREIDDKHFNVTLYPVVEKNEYLEAETSVFFHAGELLIERV